MTLNWDDAHRHQGRRVAIVVGEELLRDALAVAYAGEGFSTATCTHEGAVDLLLREPSIDLVVVDHGASADDYWPTVKRLRHVSDVSIVALVEPGSIEKRLSALRTGADDAIVMPMNLAELLVRTDAVLRRTAPAPQDRIEVEDLVLDDEQHIVIRDGHHVILTVIEYNLLRTLCRHHRRVLSKAQLLSAVWGFEDYDHNVVEVHMSALRRKLERYGPRLIHTVRGVGYVARHER